MSSFILWQFVEIHLTATEFAQNSPRDYIAVDSAVNNSYISYQPYSSLLHSIYFTRQNSSDNLCHQRLLRAISNELATCYSSKKAEFTQIEQTEPLFT